jgi:hypothetical protein
MIAPLTLICNCFVFLRIQALNKHTNALFIVGTSIGNLLFINIGLWTTIIQMFFGINLSNRSLFGCKVNTWLNYSAGCFTFMCNCFVAFGQLLITSPKMKWQRLITRFRAQLMISIIAIIWLLIFIPLTIYNHLIPPLSTCGSAIPMINQYVNILIVIEYYFLPIILTLILFSLTWY